SVIKAPYAYGFEDADISVAGWRIQNLNNGVKGWNIDNVGFNGTKSIALRNFSNSAITHSRDEFNSPLIDLTTLGSPVLGFRIANAKKVSGDVLEIFISGDFGRTETKIYSGSATRSLTTEFVPTSSDDWSSFVFDLTPYKNMTNARIRFELRNLRGNNIFIDDFTISASTGLVDNLKQEMAFNVYPNPMGDAAYAQFELKNAQLVDINICDIAGRKITTLQQGEMQAGMHSLTINRNGLQAGIYLIQVTTKSGTFVHKLVVN
ncbi:MAG: T9SS type A sorting domain-containing protein, partial [Bacteroidia bacterium]|nr:T9SS type A sorting domain-containing protein [Bacteroidia bacterium]